MFPKPQFGTYLIVLHRTRASAKRLCRLATVPSPSTKTDASDYELAELQIQDCSHDLHEVPLSRLSDWIQKLVDVESPVHIDEVARRIADAYGVRRIGRRIGEAIYGAVDYSARTKRIERKGKFLWSAGVTGLGNANLLDFTRKIDQIAPEGIMLAIETVVANELGMRHDEIPTATCDLLGYGRTNRAMQQNIDRLVKKMISE